MQTYVFLPSMKSKLAYLCSSTSWGGLEMNHIRNASWMQQRGFDVVFFCVENSPLHKSAIEFGLQVDLIEHHKKYYDFKRAKIFIEKLDSGGFTHLITRSTRDLSISATVKQKLGDKITTAYFMEMQLGVKKKHLLHTLRFKYLDIWSCPLEWLKSQVETMTNFKGRLVVIPSAMDRSMLLKDLTKENARKELNLPVYSTLFGLIGRFDPQKGQSLLLEAMAKTKNKDFQVVLLGEPTLNEGDEYYNNLLQFIGDNKLEDRVHIRPFTNKVHIFYKAIDWLVMATKAETFGMVTVESLTTGTPVLGSNAGGTPELLSNEKGGRLFETMNAIDLATVIDEIIDTNLQFDAKQLQQLTEKFDHDKVCEQVIRELNLD